MSTKPLDPELEEAHRLAEDRAKANAPAMKAAKVAEAERQMITGEMSSTRRRILEKMRDLQENVIHVDLLKK